MDICRSLITDEGNLIEGSRLVLSRIIFSEIEDRDQESVYSEVIQEGVNPEKFSDNLVTLDKLLLDLPCGLNHHFTALCCDLIEEHGFCNLTSLQLMSEGQRRIMATSVKASRLISTSSDDCSLQLVCAVAFLNTLFRVFGEILVDNGDTFPTRENDFELIQQFRSLVDFLNNCDRMVNVHTWIRRYLSQQMGPFHLGKLLSTLDKSLHVVFRGTDGSCSSGIGYSPMNYMALYSEIRDALAEYKSE